MSANLNVYDLYNLSIGVTPEEVERATHNEVFIVRGRRRKVRISTNANVRSTTIDDISPSCCPLRQPTSFNSEGAARNNSQSESEFLLKYQPFVRNLETCGDVPNIFHTVETETIKRLKISGITEGKARSKQTNKAIYHQKNTHDPDQAGGDSCCRNQNQRPDESRWSGKQHGRESSNQGKESGNQGQESGNQGQESGNQGQESGNQGRASGNQGQNQSPEDGGNPAGGGGNTPGGGGRDNNDGGGGRRDKKGSQEDTKKNEEDKASTSSGDSLEQNPPNPSGFMQYINPKFVNAFLNKRKGKEEKQSHLPRGSLEAVNPKFVNAFLDKKKRLQHLLQQSIRSFQYYQKVPDPPKDPNAKEKAALSKHFTKFVRSSTESPGQPSLIAIIDPKDKRLSANPDLPLAPIVDPSPPNASNTPIPSSMFVETSVAGLLERSKAIRKQKLHRNPLRPKEALMRTDSVLAQPSSGMTLGKVDILKDQEELHKKSHVSPEDKRKRRKAHPDEYFSDGEVSSDDDMSGNQDSPHEDDERDYEWLDIEDECQPQINDFGSDFPTEGNPEHVTDKFMSRLWPLYTAMRWTGRMPLTMVNTEKCVTFQYDRSSKEYFTFCATSIFLTSCCIASILSLIVILTFKPPFSFDEDIMISELDKYRFEGVLSFLSLYFTCAWSIWTIFEGGLHLAEYLTRWNLSVLLLRYDVSPRIRWHINLFFIVYALYAFVYISLFLFGGDAIPAARGASGFIGLLIFCPLVKELRLDPFFHVVQYFGLIFHLYFVWCAGLIIIMIISYCLALQNAAKKMNLRIAFALGKVEVPVEEENRVPYFRMIPYTKLWAEHIILTTFSRHTGAAFNVAFHAFYFTRLVAIVVTLYAVVEPIFNGFPQFNTTFLNLSQAQGNSSKNASTYENSVPVRFAEPQGVIMGKTIYFAMECFIVFFVLTQIANAAGSTLMAGFGYIRRHGTILCKTPIEKRFITSMQDSYAPNNTYFINAGYKINRAFIIEFLFIMMTMFTFLTQFSPSRMKEETTIVCDNAGICREVTYNRNYGVKVGELIPKASTTSAPSSTTTTAATGLQASFNYNVTAGRTSFAPCLPEGLLPIHLQDFTTTCHGKDSTTYLPMVFTKKGNHFDQINPNCKTNILPTRGEKVFNCFGDEIRDLVYDECNIPKVTTPDLKGHKTNPSVELIAFPKKGKPEKLFCCYKFNQLEDQAKRCNLWNPPDYSKVCTKPKSEKREFFEELLLREISALNMSESSPEENSKLDWTKWKKCLCQEYETGRFDKWNDALCEELLPTTTTTTMTTTTTAITTTTKALSSPTTPSTPTTSTIKPGALHCEDGVTKHSDFKEKMMKQCSDGQYIFGYTDEERKNVYFFQDCDSNSSDTLKTFVHPKTGQAVWDCYGKRYPKGQYRDDCGNFKLSFPHPSGKKVSPKLITVDAIENPKLRFRCCWEYPGPDYVFTNKNRQRCNMRETNNLAKLCASRVKGVDEQCSMVSRINDKYLNLAVKEPVP